MNQVRDLLYLLLGYLSGCVLYAEVFSCVFHKEIASAAKEPRRGECVCARWILVRGVDAGGRYAQKGWFPWRCICTICPKHC